MSFSGDTGLGSSLNQYDKAEAYQDNTEPVSLILKWQSSRWEWVEQAARWHKSHSYQDPKCIKGRCAQNYGEPLAFYEVLTGDLEARRGPWAHRQVKAEHFTQGVNKVEVGTFA